MHHYVKSSNETLRKRGYRLTPQRHMILSVIQEADGHLSIDQITERVQKHNPYVSLSTVYRTLELLRELGLVREVHLPGEQPHYEPVEGTAHHQLVCRLLLEKKNARQPRGRRALIRPRQGSARRRPRGHRLLLPRSLLPHAGRAGCSRPVRADEI